MIISLYYQVMIWMVDQKLTSAVVVGGAASRGDLTWLGFADPKSACVPKCREIDHFVTPIFRASTRGDNLQRYASVI